MTSRTFYRGENENVVNYNGMANKDMNDCNPFYTSHYLPNTGFVVFGM